MDDWNQLEFRCVETQGGRLDPFNDEIMCTCLESRTPFAICPHHFVFHFGTFLADIAMMPVIDRLPATASWAISAATEEATHSCRQEDSLEARRRTMVVF